MIYSSYYPNLTASAWQIVGESADGSRSENITVTVLCLEQQERKATTTTTIEEEESDSDDSSSTSSEDSDDFRDCSDDDTCELVYTTTDDDDDDYDEENDNPDTWINWVRTLDTGKDVRDGGDTRPHTTSK
jgi:hypothetical protein